MFLTSLAGCALAAAAFGAIRAGVSVHGRRRANQNVVICPLSADEVSLVIGKFAATSAAQLDARLEAQRAGSTTLLVGWLQGRPVGVASIDWEGPQHPTVHALFPACPEIHSVEVDSSLRSSGTGSHLLAVCEGMAIARGFQHIGLAVAVNNAQAYALYLRLGYTELQRIEYDAPSVVSLSQDAGSRLRFLIKSL